MPANDLRLPQSGYPSRRSHRASAHGHRTRHRKSLLRGHFLRRMVLNLCLLTGGGALLGTAFHYYYRGDFEEPKNTKESVARTEHDFLLSFLYTLAGSVPLALGIRGEVRRKQAIEKRVQARAKISRSKSPWPEDQ